jgi:hydrogenase-4 membrane subunit HyfE
VSFGLLFALFGIVPAIVLFSVTIKLGPAALLAAAAILAVWLVALALVQSTLQTIYQAAIYCYAANGEAPHGFDGSMIAEAFREKPTNKWL